MRELSIHEAHWGRLIGNFGVFKTLNFLHGHFYWPKMKRYVHRICDSYIRCRQAKSKFYLMVYLLIYQCLKNLTLIYLWILC